MIFPFHRVFVWFFSLSLILSSDVVPWTVPKLNTSSNWKQIHHALFSIPENLMMQNRVCKVSLFKRTLVFQLYLETVFCIFYFKLWLLYLVWGFFHKLFLAEFKARMYLKRHMAQKIVYHSKVLSLKLLKFFQKKKPLFWYTRSDHCQIWSCEVMALLWPQVRGDLLPTGSGQCFVGAASY